MNVLLIPLVFLVTLIAELPDKSMFASLVLGTRFKPGWVFLGVAAAFLVHVVLAVTAGGLLTLLPHRVLEIVVTVLFLAGSGYMWWSAGADEDPTSEVSELNQASEEPAAAGSGGQVVTRTRPALTAFSTAWVVVFIGEWGDITQILTANLAAKYQDPIAVGIGAVLGLWTAALLAISLGRTLLRYVSMIVLQRVGAVLLLCFGLYSAAQVVRG